jgi:hypothetical protein
MQITSKRRRAAVFLHAVVSWKKKNERQKPLREQRATYSSEKLSGNS